MIQQHVIVAGSTSVVLNVYIRDAAGGARTGLAYNTSGLSIKVMENDSDGDPSGPHEYTSSGSTIQDITLLNTWSSPSSGKIRFKEISSSGAPGWYELQFHDDLFVPAGLRAIMVRVSGASDMAGDVAYIRCTPVPADARQIGGVSMTAALGEPGATRANWTLLDWISFLGRYVANKMTLTKSTALMTVYKDNSTDVLTQQTVSDDGSSQTRSKA